MLCVLSVGRANSELPAVERPMLMNYLAGVVNLSKVCPGLDVGGQDL